MIKNNAKSQLNQEQMIAKQNASSLKLFLVRKINHFKRQDNDVDNSCFRFETLGDVSDYQPHSRCRKS